MTNRAPKTPFWVRQIEGLVRLTGGGRLSLDAHRLIARSGYSFNDKSFLPALDSFCQALEGDRSLTFLGRRALRWMILDALKRRQRVERDRREHPEIAAIPITRPIFVLGLPRTGSTFLQQLLTLDPECRWLRPWELQTPYPEKDHWGGSRDRRRRAHEKAVVRARKRGELEVIHSAGSPAECWQLLWTSFTSHTAFLFFGLGESYQRWQATSPLSAEKEAYRFYRLQLQHLMWIQPAEYWVLKAPEHSVHLAALVDTFPDAVLVQLHREPQELVPSMCSLASHCQSSTVWACEDRKLGADVVRTMNQWKQINAIERGQLPPGRIIDLNYRDLVARPLAALARIYEAAGISFDEAHRDYVNRWVEDNRTSRREQHQYSLEQFGLDVATVEMCATTAIESDAAPLAAPVETPA